MPLHNLLDRVLSSFSIASLYNFTHCFSSQRFAFLNLNSVSFTTSASPISISIPCSYRNALNSNSYRNALNALNSNTNVVICIITFMQRVRKETRSSASSKTGDVVCRPAVSTSLSLLSNFCRALAHTRSGTCSFSFHFCSISFAFANVVDSCFSSLACSFRVVKKGRVAGRRQ